MKVIENGFFDNTEITEPCIILNSNFSIINKTDNPIWVKIINSNVKAKTDYPFLLKYFTNYSYAFNIQILPE